MKHIALFAVFCAVSVHAQSVHAQEGSGIRPLHPPIDRQLSAAQLPVRLLNFYLTLTEAQQTKILEIGRSSTDPEASQKIAGALTKKQRKRLSQIIGALEALKTDKIPLIAAPELKLTEAQLEKLAGLGKARTRSAVEEILTPEQRAFAEKARRTMIPMGGMPGRR
jgi:Spy/CpxP family protein refolding chaperone